MMPEDPYEAIAALKRRLAEMEAMAAQPRGDLEDAVGAHYNPAQPPVDRKTRDLRNAAHGWQPDDQMERAIRSRDRDPAAYAAAMAAMHADGMGLVLYERGRVASLALGTFTPSTDDEAGDAS